MSGNLTFTVKNDGDQVTEFYLLAEDGLRILGEVENIGPGLTRNLVVTVPAGKYNTACKPGMVGDGIRASLRRGRLGHPAGSGQGPAGAHRPGDGAVRRLRQGPDRTAGGRHQEVRRGLRRRRRRHRQRALRRNPHALGADRTGGRVLRRPRPQAGRPRGGPGRGRGLDRLAPCREGPVPAGRVPGADRRGA